MNRLLAMILTIASFANAGIYLKYQDPWNTSQTLNVSGVKVCIFTLGGELVATTAASNSNGYIATNNLSLSSGQRYIVAALAKNSAGDIHMGTSCAGDLLSFLMGLGYSAFDPVQTLSGTVIKNTNSIITLNGYMVRAMDMLNRARNVATSDFGFTPPPIDIWWNPCTVVNDAWPRFYSIDESSFVSELASNIFGQRIELQEEFATSERWFFCTIAHEFGHFLQYKMYENNLPDGDGPDPHYIYSLSSPEFALTEGWAEFFGDYVLTRNGLKGTFNLENFCRNYGLSSKPKTQEGRVAGFFWDIVDNTPTEQHDDAAESSLRISSIFQNQKPSNIDDFLADWQTSYGNKIDNLFNMTFIRQFIGEEFRAIAINGLKLTIGDIDDETFPVVLGENITDQTFYSGRVKIDWGDGNSEIVTRDVTKSCRLTSGCIYNEYMHTYTKPGVYPLSISYEVTYTNHYALPDENGWQTIWEPKSQKQIAIKPDITPILNLLLGD